MPENARAGLTPEERANIGASLCPTHQQRLQVAETCPMCAWLEANTNQKLLAVEAERDALREKADAPSRPLPLDRISLWPFDSAPEHLRALSQHGGDEDWVVFVPAGMLDPEYQLYRLIGFIGVCDTSEHQVDGGTIYIGAHA